MGMTGMLGHEAPAGGVHDCHVPRIREIPASSPQIHLVAGPPSVTRTRGCTASTCSNRYGPQAAMSSGVGARSPGNRDFSTLAMESGSFIEDNLRHQCSDMLYSLETGKGKVLIYCLVEHQSRAEKLMAFRLMRYSIAAMQRHLEQGHQQLPVVVPLLFYHGPSSPYPYTTQWLDCFTDRALALKVYTKPFPLVDVTAMEDEEILTHRRVALLELVQKHIRTRDMMELGQMIADLLNQWTLNPEQFRGLMYYIFERGNTESPEIFLGVLAREAHDYREQVMSIAQQLEQKGLEKGLQQGMQRGQQQGRQEATLEMARQFLANGVERHVVKISTGLSDEELDNLSDSN